jgi:hypothetical protein
MIEPSTILQMQENIRIKTPNVSNEYYFVFSIKCKFFNGIGATSRKGAPPALCPWITSRESKGG